MGHERTAGSEPQEEKRILSRVGIEYSSLI